ncbi:MAG TPA: hypothetical protein VG406_13055 [Isosphaeraceae bacterium]|jgi:hypothetical protein|nr:hypothetical protein [Isosphaeraceae bacterium]
MDANDRRRRPRPPAGLLAMIALVTLVEAIVARHALDLKSIEEWDWSLNGQAARGKVRDRDLLCFGDSLVKLGVLPPVIERASGLRATNLSVCAAQASTSYFQLRRALEAGAKPKGVVVDFFPYFLTLDHREHGQLLPELLEVRDAIDLARSRRDAGLAGSILLAKLLPSLRDRAAIRAGVAAALRGEPASKRFETFHCQRNWRLNGGGMVFPRNDRFRGEFDPKNPVLFDVDWRPDPVNVGYVRRFLALARSRGVRVYWLLPPIVPEAQARRDRLGVEAAQERFIDGMLAEFPDVVVLDARHSGYESALFWDPIHLDRHGATALSVGVAMAVERGAQGRWVALPSYRPRPILERAVEDIEQSRLAIHDRDPAGGRR